MGVGAIVGFAAAVDPAGDMVAWFERCGGKAVSIMPTNSLSRILVGRVSQLIEPRLCVGEVEALLYHTFGGSSLVCRCYVRVTPLC